jgi:hypothetical protein
MVAEIGFFLKPQSNIKKKYFLDFYRKTFTLVTVKTLETLYQKEKQLHLELRRHFDFLKKKSFTKVGKQKVGKQKLENKKMFCLDIKL